MLFLFFILLIFPGCSAFFSGSETALMAISRLRLKLLAETKPRRAAMVEKILKNPEKLIGAILLGNNLVNVAMSAIAKALAMSPRRKAGIFDYGCRRMRFSRDMGRTAPHGRGGS